MAEAPSIQSRELQHASARRILGEFSNSRIDPKSITFAPNGLYARGGQGEVVLAFIVPPPEGESTNESVQFAVKQLYFDGERDRTNTFNGFANEVGLLKRISHTNIVKLVGFVEDELNDVAWFVFPWEHNGNLREFAASVDLEIPERISLIQDVTNGVAYLHGREQPICHGDLKSANILINANFRAVITDFGSSRVEEPSIQGPEDAETEVESDEESELGEDFTGSPKIDFCSISGTLMLTCPVYYLGWIAPEVLAGENAGLPSDIWSLGWVCWEVMTNAIPFPQNQHTGSISPHIVTGRLPTIQDDSQTSQVLALCNLMTDCWKQKAERRPNAQHCLGSLHWMPSSEPSPGHEIRSATLLLKLGEAHWAQNNAAAAISSYKRALGLARSTQNFKVVGAALLGLADAFSRISQALDAEEHITDALEIFTRAEDEWGVARCHLALARLRYLQSRHSEAEQLFSESMEINRRIEDQIGAVMALEGLGEVCQAQLKFSEAAQCLYHALEVYRGVGNQMGQGNTLIRLGNIYRLLARYKDADLLFLEALNVFTRIDSAEGRGSALAGLANIQIMQSNTSQAESYFLEGIRTYERLGDQVGESCTLNGLAELYRAQSRYTEAEAYFSRALDICTGIGNELEKGKALIGLGKTYRIQFKYAGAQDAYARAVEVFKSIGDEMGRANALNGLGEVSLGYLKHPEAHALFSEALAVSDGLNYDLGRGNALLGLGHSNRALGIYPAAEAFFVRALEVYTRVGNITGKAHSLNELGRTYATQNKYPQADICLSEAMEYFRQCGQEISVASALISLGYISVALQDFLTAEQRWTEARGIFSRLGHTDGETTAEKCLSHISTVRTRSRGLRSRLLVALACLGFAWIAWIAMQPKSWLYTFRSRLTRTAA